MFLIVKIFLGEFFFESVKTRLFFNFLWKLKNFVSNTKNSPKEEIIIYTFFLERKRNLIWEKMHTYIFPRFFFSNLKTFFFNLVFSISPGKKSHFFFLQISPAKTFISIKTFTWKKKHKYIFLLFPETFFTWFHTWKLFFPDEFFHSVRVN